MKAGRDRPITIKVTPEELEAIRKLAGIFGGGNVSEWIRRAAIRYRPGPHPGRPRRKV